MIFVYLVTPNEQSPGRLELLARELDLRVDHVKLLTLEKAIAGSPFDLSMVMANEAMPPIPGLARKNYFLCQFPFPAEVLELARRSPFWADYESVIVYSAYAKTHARKAIREISVPKKPIRVIHPPVSQLPTPPDSERRDGMILSVGRFFSDAHSKRQDELIDSFRMLSAAGCSLHLAGTVHEHQDSRDMFELCRMRAQGLPVILYPNATRADLAKLYAEADCYWHGAGLGADRENEPEKFEHLGISVVEAMASGCIPFVLDQGGPASIVTSGKNGWIYATTTGLAQMTSHFFTSMSSDVVQEMRVSARERARAFGVDVFRAAWIDLLN